ncbi:MAG: hypothetical protein ACP5E3_18725, partial [Bacteroidales bacterium]
MAGLFVTLAPFREFDNNIQNKSDGRYFIYSLDAEYPRFDYLSIDSLGKGKLNNSPILISDREKDITFSSMENNNITQYFETNYPDIPAWEFELTRNGFILKSNYIENNVPWILKIDQTKNHATVLGRMQEKNKINLPALIHFPDMGSFQVKSDKVDILDYTSARLNVPVKFVQVSLPPATKEQK